MPHPAQHDIRGRATPLRMSFRISRGEILGMRLYFICGSLGVEGVRLFMRLELTRGLDELVAPVYNERFTGDEVTFEQEYHGPCYVVCVSGAL
jgi:hypothetical protein